MSEQQEEFQLARSIECVMEGQETKLERQVESSSRGVLRSAEKFALSAVNSSMS